MFFTLMVGTRGSLVASHGVPTVNIFFTLMVGALASSGKPPRGPAINVFSIDDGHSRIFGTASKGAHHRCFFTLMVGAP
jgi:hypothetical protein